MTSMTALCRQKGNCIPQLPHLVFLENNKKKNSWFRFRLICLFSHGGIANQTDFGLSRETVHMHMSTAVVNVDT